MNDVTGLTPPIPRFRLSRNSLSPNYGGNIQHSALAGPSRLSDQPNLDFDTDLHEHDNGDDQSTPRMFSVPIDPSPIAIPDDTPAARLRAVLSRIPNHLVLDSVSLPLASPPSEVESDYDALQFSSVTPSLARESLKDLFSRALGDQGGTPHKGNRRRNSVDAGGAEASPRVEKERAGHRGKRRSLSDEEVDKLPNLEQQSEAFRASYATSFDSLRERLTNSQMKTKPPKPSEHPEYKFNSVADESPDTSTFLRDLNFSQASQPPATSTPQMSFQIPSFYRSNLLEQDSEMHRVINDVDSYEGESGPNQLPQARSPECTKKAQHVSPPDSRSVPSRSKSHSPDLVHNPGHSSRRESRAMSDRSSSRSSSSLSATEYQERRHVDDRDRIRERQWNKPRPRALIHPGSPHVPLYHSHGTSRSASPAIGVGLRNGPPSWHGSATSLRSVEDDASNSSHTTGSLGPQAEYREQTDELEKDQNTERERAWSMHNFPRPTTSLSVNSPSGRTRASSHPTHSDSAHSLPSPPTTKFQRHHSSSSSRAGSVNDSFAGRHPEEMPKMEVDHEIERERNWNAPHPKWGSPLPPSPSSFTSLHQVSPARAKADSLQVSGTVKSESPIHRGRQSPLIQTNLSHPNIRKTAPRGASPSLAEPKKPVSQSRFQSARPTSYRPISYPELTSNGTSVLRARGYKWATTELTNSLGRNSPQIKETPFPAVRDMRNVDSVSGTDQELPVQEETPTTRTVSHSLTLANTPEDGPPRSPSPQNVIRSDEVRLYTTLASAPIFQEVSSPPSLAASNALSPSLLSSIAPRRLHCSNSRQEFQTPSPSKGLLELPEPLSSSEDDVDKSTEHVALGLSVDVQTDLTVSGTPRPPGAWASTLVPPIGDSALKSLSVPNDHKDSQSGTSLATPTEYSPRASSLPPMTPTPPGAWMTAPAPRKSVLKVRFDTQPPGSEENVGALIMDSSSSRKSPSIRLVDALGREQPSGYESIRQESRPLSSIEDAIQNKSAVKVVDAMGREVDDISGSQNTEDSFMEHNDALERVRRGLADLAEGISDMERTNEDIRFDQDRLNALNNMSKAARETRDKLTQTLQMAHHSENKLRNSQLRVNMNKRKSLPSTVETHHRIPVRLMNRCITVGFLLFQFLLVILMYHVATIWAKDIFLTTYYDPFYPDLHLYTTKPDTLGYFTSTSQRRSSGSASSIPDTFQQIGSKGVIHQFRDGFIIAVAKWQRYAWETWGDNEMQKNSSWPPT